MLLNIPEQWTSLVLQSTAVVSIKPRKSISVLFLSLPLYNTERKIPGEKTLLSVLLWPRCEVFVEPGLETSKIAKLRAGGLAFLQQTW